MGKMQDTVICS